MSCIEFLWIGLQKGRSANFCPGDALWQERLVVSHIETTTLSSRSQTQMPLVVPSPRTPGFPLSRSSGTRLGLVRKFEGQHSFCWSKLFRSRLLEGFQVRQASRDRMDYADGQKFALAIFQLSRIFCDQHRYKSCDGFVDVAVGEAVNVNVRSEFGD